MRGLEKYEARVAIERRATSSMGDMHRAIRKREARRRRGPMPEVAVLSALPALNFAASDPETKCSEDEVRATARAMIEEGSLLVARVLGQGSLLVAPREERPLPLQLGAVSCVVPLAISDAPVSLFNGTGRVVSVRLWKNGSVPIYALCASEHAVEAQPSELGLSKRGYEDMQRRVAWILGARLS